MVAKDKESLLQTILSNPQLFDEATSALTTTEKQLFQFAKVVKE